jgi:cytoskeleton protein RodZ
MRNMSKSGSQGSVSEARLVPNEYLADARKQKGIEERDAADALKISVARLRSIETGEYTVFPSETYVRGHLRKYSRFLDVDEVAVVDAYNCAHPPTFDFVNPENNSKEKKNPRDASAKRPWKLVALMLAFVSLWIAAYSSFGPSSNGSYAVSSSSNPTLATPNAISKSIDIEDTAGPDDYVTGSAGGVLVDEAALLSSVVVDDELTASDQAKRVNVEIAGDVVVGNPGATLDRDSQIESSVNPAEASSSRLTTEQQLSISDLLIEPNMVVSKVTAAELVKSITTTDAVAANALAELDAHVLKFAFVNPCWVKVTDATNTVMFVGLKASNSTLSLSGEAPFNIIFGNVEGSSLIYNDMPVLLEPPANGRPLRLVVGQ